MQDTYRRRQMQRTVTRQMSFDLTKLLVTEDWFSDISPQTMRRLLNIVSVTGTLRNIHQDLDLFIVKYSFNTPSSTFQRLLETLLPVLFQIVIQIHQILLQINGQITKCDSKCFHPKKNALYYSKATILLWSYIICRSPLKPLAIDLKVKYNVN